MTRLVLLLACGLAAMPAAAQDHSGHQMPGQMPGQMQDQAQGQVEEMDHCAMGHLPPEQCPPQEPAADKHAGHAMPMDKSAAGAAQEEALPPRALEGPRHAAEAIWGAAAMDEAREESRAAHGAMTTGQFMAERLEARIGDGEDGYLWDIRAFYGGDINKFVLKSEGEGDFSGGIEEAEVQALYSRAITPFFDLQAGVRFDLEPGSRGYLALGLEGLAPYMLHIDSALFLSGRGDLTARIEAEYDQKLTQQLILQPRIELELAAQDVPERAIGSGLTAIEAGLRLRYEIRPEFAPYVGVEYAAQLGETADLARAAGEDPDGITLLIGLRSWF